MDKRGNYFYDGGLIRGEGRFAGLPTFVVDTISFLDARHEFICWSRGCNSLYQLNKYKRSARFSLSTAGHRAEGCRIDDVNQLNTNYKGGIKVFYAIRGSYEQLIPTGSTIRVSSVPTKLEPDFEIKLG